METIERQDFLTRIWDYKVGEHVTFLGPTKSGKTTLKMQLLNAIHDFPGHKVIVDTKPRNREVDEWAERFQWPVTRTMPIGPYTRARWTMKGYDFDTVVFRPPHPYDPEEGDDSVREDIKRFLLRAYHGKKNWIIDADEMLDWVDIKLDKIMRVLWSRGRSMDLGFWGGTQRPYDVPLYAYSSPTHLFFSRDNDPRNRERLRGIAGLPNPKEVDATIANLPKFHWLYLQPRDGKACIIGP